MNIFALRRDPAMRAAQAAAHRFALAGSGRNDYTDPMAVWLNRIARYAARKIASDPQARDKAVRTARTVADEAKTIARDKDRARAAGRSVRRAMNKLQNGQ